MAGNKLSLGDHISAFFMSVEKHKKKDNNEAG